MKTKEFPRLEEYETPERKREMEQKLPKVLAWSLSYFLERYLLLFSLQPGEKFPGRTQQIKELDRKQKDELILEQVGLQKYLKPIALLDISTRYLEIELDVLDAMPEEERDAEWKEERKKTLVKKEVLAYHRDRLIEREPQIHEQYTKKDFENWIRETILNLQNMLKSETDATDRGNLLERMSVQNKVLTASPLSIKEVTELLFEINYEIALYREGVGEILINYLLRKEEQENQLLDYLKNILKFRQFQVGVESKEWINFKP